MTRALAIALLCVLGLTVAARAQSPAPSAPAGFWQFPEGTVAYWAADPTFVPQAAARADRNKHAIEAALAWMLPRAAGRDSDLLPRLLAPDILGAAPYRLVLLEFRAGQQASSGGRPAPATIDSLAAVLEIREPEAFDRLDEIIRAQTRWPVKDLSLPGATAAHISAPASGPAPRAVEWARLPDRALVGFGAGSLARWLGEHRGAGPWSAPRRQVAALPRPFFEAWADVDALRTGAPELFAHGRLGPLVHAWGIQNSRWLHISGATADDTPATPRLAITAAWSPRSAVPGTIRTLALTHIPLDHPERAPSTGHAYFADLRLPVERLPDPILDTHRALAGVPGRPTAPERWLRERGSLLGRAAARDAGMIVVFGPPRDGAPHTLSASILLKPGPDAPRDAALFGSLFGTLAPEVIEPRPGTWTLRDPPPLLEGLAWRYSAETGSLELLWRAPAPPTR